MSDMRLPMSLTKCSPSAPQTPNDSTAIGTNSTDGVMSAYLVILFNSAAVAACPASALVDAIWEIAKVSGHVTSHAMQRPLRHGMVVTPSGRLLASAHSPFGSNVDGTPALLSALLMASFSNL